MKPQNLHAQEDRLLDFVYGELPPHEARAVESHLEGCARCSELLADIRGVRTTMSQLSMEPAPDAGLESLMAYAQQAARNAAAGPAPKPTWWRRWLLPVAGVAAVSVFGLVTLQVSKSVKLSPDLSAAKSESVRDAEPAPVALSVPPRAEPAPAQVAMAPAPAPQAPAKQDALAEAAPARPQPTGMADDLTPPPSPAAEEMAELGDGYPMKQAPRKKAFVAGTKKLPQDWSNAGASAGSGRTKDAEDDGVDRFADESGVEKERSYDDVRRDAVTQSRALLQNKPTTPGSVQGGMPQEPMAAPGATQPTEGAGPEAANGAVAEVQQQEAPKSEPLRLGGGSRASTESASRPRADTSGDDFDDLFGAKASSTKREQSASTAAPAPSPPPPPAMATASARPVMRPEAKGKSAEPSSAELSKMAEEALRSGDRVREALLLRQALSAGATGSLRLGLLNRLCDAEFAIGRREAAIQACSLVLEEGPRSGAAQMARKRLDLHAPESRDAKKAGSKAAKKAADMEAPASAAPADAP
ncbi:anti-sigma factor family protein [Hyalangium gracile]|uniref:anti-sigma factor family protein n=1 Tax=Hyalangium gracile TaxID=394092 RepID=UPI001CCCA481|nr:zf-HC2 domain-containing protein [Hyalangium gracile]